MRARFLIAAFLLILPLVAKSADSELDKTFAGNSSEPIKITADSLEVIQRDKVALFKGNVEAVQGKMNLKSDQMTVFYDKSKNAENNAISKIEVKGNVLLYSPTEAAKSLEGLYDVENKLVKLNGNVILTRDKNVLKGDSLVYNMVTGKSQLFGGAKEGKKGRVQGLFVPEKKSGDPSGSNRPTKR